MTQREFLGVKFYAWLQAEHDALRAKLKSQRGKPDAIDTELLRLDREWAATLHRMLTGR